VANQKNEKKKLATSANLLSHLSLGVVLEKKYLQGWNRN